MKRLIVTGILVGLLLVMLVGCAKRPDEAGGWGVREVPLPDGRTVVCVGWDNRANAGGIDCDWEGAK